MMVKSDELDDLGVSMAMGVPQELDGFNMF